jgi:protein involved in polysaccharide export with SLBB domain
VREPGAYEIERTKTVLEAIAMAGGAAPNAVLKSVVVLKGGLQNPRIRIVNLRDTIKKGGSGKEVILGSQDIVYVPKTAVTDKESFMTQVFGAPAKKRSKPVESPRGGNDVRSRERSR